MLYTRQASASPSRPLRGPAMSALRLNFEKAPSRQAKQRLWLATEFRTEDRVFDSGHSGSNGAATDLVPRQEHTMTYTHRDSLMLRARSRGRRSACGY